MAYVDKRQVVLEDLGHTGSYLPKIPSRGKCVLLSLCGTVQTNPNQTGTTFKKPLLLIEGDLVLLSYSVLWYEYL